LLAPPFLINRAEAAIDHGELTSPIDRRKRCSRSRLRDHSAQCAIFNHAKSR
jgi:hypothetical protein